MRYFLHTVGVILFSFTAVFGTGTGIISVTGGFVSGSGTISGTVIVGAAGSLYPGASVGALQIDGALNISAMADGGSGKLAFGLDNLAGFNDQITTTGTLSMGDGKLGFSDFDFTDLGGLEPGTYTLISNGGISGSLDANNLTGTINGYYGTIGISGNDIILTVNTLIGSSIVDNQSGGPVDIGFLVTYTVTFSKDMNAGSISNADFGNAGTASVTIGTVTETEPTSGIFTVPVTPTAPGTLILMVNANAVLTDQNGKNLVTSSAIADNTSITVRTAYSTWANDYLPADLSNPSGNYDSDALTNLLEFAFGTDPLISTAGTITYISGGEVTFPGLQEARNLAVGSGVDYRAVFGRRKNYVVAGLTYTVQFSAGLDVWVNSNVTPTVLTDSTGDIDAVSVPYPFFISTLRGVEKPNFFRVAVTQTP